MIALTCSLRISDGVSGLGVICSSSVESELPVRIRRVGNPCGVTSVWVCPLFPNRSTFTRTMSMLLVCIALAVYVKITVARFVNCLYSLLLARVAVGGCPRLLLSLLI